MKGDDNMISFLCLLFVVIVICIIAIVVVGLSGIGLLLVYGDIIICGLIIVLIVKKIVKSKKQKEWKLYESLLYLTEALSFCAKFTSSLMKGDDCMTYIGIISIALCWITGCYMCYMCYELGKNKGFSEGYDLGERIGETNGEINILNMLSSNEEN